MKKILLLTVSLLLVLGISAGLIACDRVEQKEY